jgi:hypothetical protein
VSHPQKAADLGNFDVHMGTIHGNLTLDSSDCIWRGHEHRVGGSVTEIFMACFESLSGYSSVVSRLCGKYILKLFGTNFLLKIIPESFIFFSYTVSKMSSRVLHHHYNAVTTSLESCLIYFPTFCDVFSH